MDDVNAQAPAVDTPSPADAPASRGLFSLLFPALWPVALVGAATLYLQAKMDAAAADAAALQASRPRLVVVDEIALMEEAMKEGATGSADAVRDAYRQKLRAVMDGNTIIVSRYSVLAVDPGLLLNSIPMRRDYQALPAAPAASAAAAVE